jgi:hypothetical protein
MAKGGARPGAGRPKKPATPNPAAQKAPRLPAAPRGGARPGAGRPMSKKFAPTADQRGNVEAMTGFGISQEEICRLIHNPETGKPIDKKTLELHFADEIETGQTKTNATVARVAYATITRATGGIDKDDHVRGDLTKFWLARRMGWKDTSVHQHQGITDGGSSVAEKLIRSFDSLAAEGAVAGENSGDDPGGNGGTGA